MGTRYPDIPPDISIFSESLDRPTVKLLRDQIHRRAQDNTGSPMLLELISHLQEQVSSLPKRSYTDKLEKYASSDVSPTEVVTMLLHIDHMRARSQYVKTIKRWTEELGLAGRIFFCNKLILLLIQGDQPSLKEYVVRHKSVNIDVDSQGHPCKEKMMSVLCEKALTSSIRLVDFQVVECQSSKCLGSIFEEQKMEELFVNYIQAIKGFI